MVDALKARRSADRLRARSRRDRQDLACRAADPVGARIAERGRPRAGRRRRSSITRSCSRRWPQRRRRAAWHAAVRRISEEARATAERPRAGAPARCGRANRFARSARRCRAETIVTTDVGLAQISVRAVLAEPSSGNVLDVERTVGHGLRAERGDRREARATGCAGAGRRRRRRVLDERAGARDRRARRRAVCDGRARRRQLFVDQARAGEPQARAVPHGLPSDRQRQDGRSVRRAGAAHVRSRRAGGGRAGAPSRQGRAWWSAVPVHYADYRKLF